jgi:DNA-3-methyladenine glycosylase II
MPQLQKTYRLQSHEKFDFEKTIHSLRRGEQDPVNIIENNRWTRCFNVKDKPVVIETFKKKHTIMNQLYGSATAPEVKNVISRCLGLDDPLWATNPGKKYKRLAAHWHVAVPGYASLFEAFVLTIFGQLVSVAVANHMRKNFMSTFGERHSFDGQTFLEFPRAEAIAHMSIDNLASLKITRMKARSIIELAQGFVEKDLAVQIALADRKQLYALLNQYHGIGRWTIDWVALRELRQFDIIPSTDLAVRKAFSWWLETPEILAASDLDVIASDLYPLGGAIMYRVLSAYSAAQQGSKLNVGI